MPEYLAPGVYVEEVSFRSKSIEGVSTTTTAFVGPTRYGPVDLVPDVITSLGEFERIYGDRQQIVFAGSARHNYMWHAVRQFFENGGKRLYISRVYQTYARLTEPAPVSSPLSSPLSPPAFPAGYASAALAAAPTFLPFVVAARFPGAGGNLQVRVTLMGGPNVFAVEAKPGGSPGETINVVRGLVDSDLVLIGDSTTTTAVNNLHLAERYISAGAIQYRFRRGGTTTELQSL
jgi:hypothetical protein